MQPVPCVHCGKAVDPRRADVTGRGYRCERCSARASLNADIGRNDIVDHLTPAERVQRSQAATGRMIGGAALAAAGVVAFWFVWAPLGLVVGCAGLGAVSHGYLTKREMSSERTS